MKDDADWNLEDDVVERGLTEFSDRHGVAKKDLDALRDRIEKFEIETHGLVDVPRLFEMVESGVDGKAAVRWLLECDLARESALLTTWEALTGPRARRVSVDTLPTLCAQGASFLRTHRDPLVADGAAQGASNWLESELSHLWRRGLFDLREGERDGQGDPVLLPQDRSFLPDARAALTALRTQVLCEAELALAGKSPASLWGRVLHAIPAEMSGPYLALAQRFDIALEGQTSDEPVGGLGDLIRLIAHFEGEMLFGDWHDVEDGLRAIEVARGFYALRMSSEWRDIEPTLIEWTSNATRRASFLHSRERGMREGLRSVLRARDARLAWRIAAGDQNPEIPEQLNRWRVPTSARERHRRRDAVVQTTRESVVVTLGPDDCFMIGGQPLTWRSGERRLTVRSSNVVGRLLQRIESEGQCTDGRVSSRDRTNLATAIREATRNLGGGVVDLARATSRPSRKLQFDDATRRKLLKGR